MCMEYQSTKYKAGHGNRYYKNGQRIVPIKVAVMSQRVHPIISQKIEEGITDA